MKRVRIWFVWIMICVYATTGVGRTVSAASGADSSHATQTAGLAEPSKEADTTASPDTAAEEKAKISPGTVTEEDRTISPSTGSEEQKDGQMPSGSGGDTDPATDLESTGSVRLKLDNSHVYDGMDKSYKKGYVPKISGKKVILVLPLIADGTLKKNRMTASLDLGDPSASPFVYKNYQKDVKLSDQPLANSKKTRRIFYVRFDLPLSSTRTDGVYPVNIQIDAEDTDGNPVSAVFTTYVTITGSPAPKDDVGEPEGGEGAEVAETRPQSQPIILLERAKIAGNRVEAGSEFTAEVILKNTNGKKPVQNMVVTVSCESPEFTLLNDSNTLYLDRISAGCKETITLRYRTGKDTPAGQYPILLSMSYDNEEALTLTSEGSFTVQVYQPLTLEMTMPPIAETVRAGDTIPLSFQVMNLGRSMAYNVRCELSGNGLKAVNTGFVGNMEAGSAGTAEMNLFIDMLEGEESYGLTEGVVTLRYEDAEGKEYTEEQTFKTTIERPLIQSQPEEPESPDTAGQWWISVLIAGVVLLLGITIWLIRHRYISSK